MLPKFLDVPVSTLVDMEMNGVVGLSAKINAMIQQEPELAKVFEEAFDLVLQFNIFQFITTELATFLKCTLSYASDPKIVDIWIRCPNAPSYDNVCWVIGIQRSLARFQNQDWLSERPHHHSEKPVKPEKDAFER